MNKKNRIRDLEARIVEIEGELFGYKISPVRAVPPVVPTVIVPGHYRTGDVLRNCRTGENMAVVRVVSHVAAPPLTKAQITRGIGSVPETPFKLTDPFTCVATLNSSEPFLGEAS